KNRSILLNKVGLDSFSALHSSEINKIFMDEMEHSNLIDGVQSDLMYINHLEKINDIDKEINEMESSKIEHDEMVAVDNDFSKFNVSSNSNFVNVCSVVLPFKTLPKHFMDSITPSSEGSLTETKTTYSNLQQI